MKIIVLYLLATASLAAETGKGSEKVKRGLLLGSGGLELGPSLSQTNLDGISGGLSSGISGLGQGLGAGLSGTLAGKLNTGITGASIHTINQHQVPLVVPHPYPITRPVMSPYSVRQNFQSLINEAPIRTPQVTSRRLSIPENLRIPQPIPISQSSIHQTELSQQSPIIITVSSGSQTGLSSNINSDSTGIIGNRLTGGLSSGLGLPLSSGLGNLGSSALNIGSGLIPGLESNLGLSNLGSGLGSHGLIPNLATVYGPTYGYATSGIGGLDTVQSGSHVIVIRKH